MTDPVVFTFTSAGSATARRIAEALGGTLEPGTADEVRAAFRAGTPVIGVCAAGILIRLLAPVLADKHAEPPVVAVSADGNSVVPLLGGHHGANALAGRIAAATGGHAAVTTASAGRFVRALDEPPEGYVLVDPDRAKPAMAAVLDGASIRLDGAAPWLAEAGYPLSEDGTVEIVVTERTGPIDGLVYHPRTLVAGVGCERGTEAGEVIDLIEAVLAEHGLAPQSLAAIASVEIKADEPALNAAADRFGVPLRLFSRDELAAESARLPNPSEAVRTEIGIPGVAEAAALKAGTLMVEKRKSARATCAIGRAPAPLDVAAFGRAPGRLHIVGIGPGEPAQRTASAVTALRAATDWVGYGLYLDLVADLARGQVEHRYGLGDEEPRVRHALELAATGRTVALVCSGDAQIYAMGALVFELLDADGPRALSEGARRVAVETHPGISAFQMASARAGALIGHDFCTISLSDLLTPRPDILGRLRAAAEGDFVTALYNPRSKRRTDLIETAFDLFRAHRPPDTPVIIATSLGRPEERVRTVPLAEFDPQEVDMLTIVLVGSSASRRFARGDGTAVAYTPRGYERKAKGDAA